MSSGALRRLGLPSGSCGSSSSSCDTCSYAESDDGGIDTDAYSDSAVSTCVSLSSGLSSLSSLSFSLDSASWASATLAPAEPEDADTSSASEASEVGSRTNSSTAVNSSASTKLLKLPCSSRTVLSSGWVTQSEPFKTYLKTILSRAGSLTTASKLPEEEGVKTPSFCAQSSKLPVATTDSIPGEAGLTVSRDTQVICKRHTR
ncbi:hypothetical protein CLUG_02850 [Clavispora lusitaniae ATCC 42720]|uniref:Uncharacterized protein n=1 Tax=Clavispora lusitaniae (strain ATCC 42720) TaxID=306902 RepID=C4Y2T7_CLAL4|nr:uncharacterized protein CLUG_02850 [Clavispora lusitaniae ATCC 42720]EEQ38725.1 hypothetical protein CLUG_02850 [Clavispora lusitaniae ATCC 42720]